MEGAKEIRKGFICSICNDFLRDSYNLPCGHTFCLECINDALADHNSCPTCLNPAWQKDILKTALADSAVQEWVTHCEAKFLAHVARQAEQGDDEETETDSAMSEAPSEDDEHGDTDVEQEEEQKREAPSTSAATTPQQPAAPQVRDDEEMSSAATASVPVGAGAPDHSAGQGLTGAVNTHGSQSNGARAGGGGGGGGGGAGASSLSDAKLAAVDGRRSAVGGQEKENFAAPGARPSSVAAVSGGESVAAAPSPRVVGVRRAAAWSSSSSSSSSSDRTKAPRVRFQPSPLRACGSEADPCAEGVFGEGSKASSQQDPLPPTIATKTAGASSSLVVEGTASAREAAAAVETLARERETPEAPRLEKGHGNSSATSSPAGLSAPAGLERRGFTTPRRILEKACEDAASTPRPSPSVLPAAGRKGAAAVGDREEASGFALALPDTCDIVDAGPSPPHSPVATTNAMLFTPPGFAVGQAGSAAVAAGFGVDAAGATACPVGRVGPDSGGRGGDGKLAGVDGGASPGTSVAEDCGKYGRERPSPQSRVEEEPPRGLPRPTSKEEPSSSPAAEGEDVPVEHRTGSGRGNPLVGRHQDTDVEGSLANGDVRDGSRVSPARRAARDAGRDSGAGCPADGGDGSRSEDEISDAESVPLLGDDESQRGENGQHQQRDPMTSISPSRAMPSSRSVSPVGGAAGCSSDAPEEIAQLSSRSGGGEEAEDEGEETCDEDCDEAGAARKISGGDEQSTPGSDTLVGKRKDQAAGVEAARPRTGDEPERPAPAESAASPSSPSLIRPGFSTGGGVAEREALHSAAAVRDAAGTSTAKEQPAVNLARPASPALPAPPAAGEQHEERTSPAAQTTGAEPAVAMPAGSSSPRSASPRGQSPASAAPTQGFSLRDERQADDKGVAGVEGDERGDGRAGLRVAETLPQTLGLGGGGVRGEGEVAEPRGVDGDAAVSETLAESVPLAEERRKRKDAQSFAGDVEAEDDPIVPETSAQSPDVAGGQEGRGSKSLVDGVVDLSACGVQVAGSSRERAESQEQRRRGDGDAAAFDEEKPGMQEARGEDGRGASGSPAQPAGGPQGATLSQAAPLEEGSGNDPGAPRRHHPPKDSGEELSRLHVRGPAERRLENDHGEVRGTLLSREEASGRVEASREGCKPASAVCPGTQGSPAQDGPGAHEDGHEDKAGRRVPETAAQTVTSQEIQTLSTQEVPETAAQSITTQQIQTLGTQEVSETARAWGSNAECGRDSSAQLERGASGTMMSNSSCPQSEAVETQPLRDGATTQSPADCAGGDGEARGKREQSAANARRSPSLSSSALPSEAVSQGPAENDTGPAAQEQAGAICLETPDGASAGSLCAGGAGLHRHAGGGEYLESAKSPGSGSRKRSADSATLSPSRTSSAPGSPGKRSRMTPPPVGGEPRPVRPGAATGDEAASPHGLADRGSRRARQEAGEGEQRPRMALRGGSGSGESGNESELPETDHDLAAVQDAWLAEGGYEFGDDGGGYPEDDADEPGESRPPSPPPPKRKAIFNPYAQQAHLDLRADDGDDSCAPGAAGTTKLPPGREASEGHGGAGVAAGATAVQGRSSRPALLPRPSKSTMSFGASSVGVARAASGLAGSALASRLKEQRYRQSSNSILAAGRGHGTVGTTAAKETGSWPTYDMGPDTQEVVEVAACLANQRAEKKPRGGVAMESSPVDPINLDDDDDDDDRAEQGNRRGRGGAEGETSAEKKRKRSAAAAAAASKGKGPGRSSNRDESRRHRPVVVLLGCSSRELKRAQQLCQRLGLRQPETELVSGATHVVVGSRQTRVRSSSGGGGRGSGGGCPLDTGKEQGAGRRELVKHEMKGYREAVMLGLWVLDFSWVEACWAATAEAGAEAGDTDDRGNDGAHTLAAPPRAFELLGCSKGHEGCEPRRGRYKKGSGVPGAFDGIEFVPVVAETALGGAGGRPPSPSRLELEVLRSETERLVKLGGGVFVSAPKRPSRTAGPGYLDNPFDDSGDDGVGDVDAGGTAHGRGGSGAGGGKAAKGNRVVVLALPDCLDGHGVSQGLAKAATRRRQELGADAAVDQAWVLQSVDKGSPISFGDYDLRNSARSQGGGGGGGGGGNSKRAAAPQSRLSIPRGSSSRCEVLLDMENEGGGRMVSAEAVRAQREQTARILKKAEEVVEAPLRQKLPPLDPTEVGEDGFDFTRRGSKKAPVKANVTTYAAENKAQRDLIDALGKGGYLDLDGSDDEYEMDRIDKEKRLGEYWYDYVYDGFFMKRSENAIPEAKRRGCPVDILRAEHESHVSIQTERSRGCVKELPGEFLVWKAGKDADDAVELL